MPLTPPFGTDRAPRWQTGWLLQRAYRNARREFSAGLAETGLDAPHFGVLLHLSHEQPLSQTQLAERNNSDRTAMVRTLDDLEDLGYVVRRQSARDRRANEVSMTPAGRKAYATAQRSASRVTERLFASLTPDEHRQLDALLTKVIAEAESDED